MRFVVVGAAFVGLSLVTAGAARAATCTVTSANVLIQSVGLTGRLPSIVGLAIPVTIDEAAGTMEMDFSVFPETSFSLSGVASTIDLTPGTGQGTIDASGNVVLTGVGVDFTTDQAPGQPLGATEELTAGIAAVTLTGTDYPTVGAPLDFATGDLRVDGQAVLTNAPVIGLVTTGFSLACTLAPVPSQANLPKGPSLVAHGVGKPAKTSGSGDTLTLAGKLDKGDVTLDPTKDVFVRIAAGSDETLLLWVPAGSLEQKGKKFSASDSGGAVIHVLTGRKEENGTQAAISGKLSFKQTKKGFLVKLKESGLDLAPLAAAGAAPRVTIGVGPLVASDDVTAKASAKKIVLK